MLHNNLRTYVNRQSTYLMSIIHIFWQRDNGDVEQLAFKPPDTPLPTENPRLKQVGHKWPPWAVTEVSLCNPYPYKHLKEFYSVFFVGSASDFGEQSKFTYLLNFLHGIFPTCFPLSRVEPAGKRGSKSRTVSARPEGEFILMCTRMGWSKCARRHPIIRFELWFCPFETTTDFPILLPTQTFPESRFRWRTPDS